MIMKNLTLKNTYLFLSQETLLTHGSKSVDPIDFQTSLMGVNHTPLTLGYKI